MRRWWVLAVIALASTATACPDNGGSGGSGSSGGASTTASTTPPLVAPTSPNPPGPTASRVTLTVTDLRLVNSEESDNGFRVFLDAASDALDVSVTVTGGVPSPNRTILVCPAVELENRVRAPGCAMPASGEAVKVPHLPNYRGIEVIQVGVTGSGPGASTTAIGEIAVTFPATTREVRMRLPVVAAGDAGGRPTFRMTPVGPGTYRASAQWSPSGGNSGEAELTLNTVTSNTATSNTATSTVSRAQGGPGTLLTGNLSPAGDATIRFRNTGSTALLRTVLTILFP